MKKMTLLLIAVLCFLSGLAFTIKVFPNPYHTQDEPYVTFAEWVKREIYELIHGEVPVNNT